MHRVAGQAGRAASSQVEGVRERVGSRLSAAEADPAAATLRHRVPDATSEAELRRLWEAWRSATFVALLRGRVG